MCCFVFYFIVKKGRVIKLKIYIHSKDNDVNWFSKKKKENDGNSNATLDDAFSILLLFYFILFDLQSKK